MNNPEEYLAHHGIKGQRWGIRRTPEQLGHRTPSKRRQQREKKAEERKEERARKKAAKNLEDKENLKTYLRKHPKKLPKYSAQLTQDEANEIIQNIQFDKKLKDIKKAETDRTWDKINTFNNRMKTVSSVMATGIGIYNNTALIYNALYDIDVLNGKDMGKRKKLPQASWGGKDKDNKNNNN